MGRFHINAKVYADFVDWRKDDVPTELKKDTKFREEERGKAVCEEAEPTILSW